jgi:hypothetical protein
MLGVVEGIFLHLWRDKSKDCIKCFDAIYPMSGCPTDSCLWEFGNKLGSPHSDGSGTFPAAPDTTLQSQKFGSEMLDAEDLATF